MTTFLLTYIVISYFFYSEGQPISFSTSYPVSDDYFRPTQYPTGGTCPDSRFTIPSSIISIDSTYSQCPIVYISVPSTIIYIGLINLIFIFINLFRS